jgi:hypothetical protein
LFRLQRLFFFPFSSLFPCILFVFEDTFDFYQHLFAPATFEVKQGVRFNLSKFLNHQPLSVLARYVPAATGMFEEAGGKVAAGIEYAWNFQLWHELLLKKSLD